MQTNCYNQGNEMTKQTSFFEWKLQEIHITCEVPNLHPQQLPDRQGYLVGSQPYYLASFEFG